MNIREVTSHIIRNRKKIAESLTYLADLLECLEAATAKRPRKKIKTKKQKP